MGLNYLENDSETLKMLSKRMESVDFWVLKNSNASMKFLEYRFETPDKLSKSVGS